MQDEQTRIPPCDLDAEEAVLGSILIDPDTWPLVSLILEPHDFYRDKNRWTYDAALAVADRNEAINQITVAQELARTQRLEASGGAAFLSHLVGQVPTTVHAEHYAKLVKRLSHYRKLLRASSQIAALAYEAPGDMEQAQEQAEQILARLRNGSDSDAGVRMFESLLEDYPNMLRDVAEGRQGATLTTGWPTFDDKVVFRRGTLSLVAGRSSVGKTIVAEHLVERSSQLGLNCAWFRNELTDLQAFNRLTCRHLVVADQNGHPRAPQFRDLEQGEYFDHEGLVEMIDRISRWPGRSAWVYCPGWTAHKICAKIRRLAAQGRADVVVLDYLQQIPMGDFMGKNGLNYAQAVGAAVQVLKDTVANLPNQPPLILMSQLNSEQEIRNSGEPHEKANVLIRIHNEWRATEGRCIYNCPHGRKTSCHQHCIKLLIVKNTFGPTGYVEVWHDTPRFRFYERSETERDESQSKDRQGEGG